MSGCRSQGQPSSASAAAARSSERPDCHTAAGRPTARAAPPVPGRASRSTSGSSAATWTGGHAPAARRRPAPRPQHAAPDGRAAARPAPATDRSPAARPAHASRASASSAQQVGGAGERLGDARAERGLQRGQRVERARGRGRRPDRRCAGRPRGRGPARAHAATVVARRSAEERPPRSGRSTAACRQGSGRRSRGPAPAAPSRPGRRACGRAAATAPGPGRRRRRARRSARPGRPPPGRRDGRTVHALDHDRLQAEPAAGRARPGPPGPRTRPAARGRR